MPPGTPEDDPGTPPPENWHFLRNYFAKFLCQGFWHEKPPGAPGWVSTSWLKCVEFVIMETMIDWSDLLQNV